MISLIICSRAPDIPAALEANIRDTIGVVYETIIIDNSRNSHSIFEAYNIGVSRSKYDILCFMHDDINYHTANWGQNVSHHFADRQTGAIGIAGSPYVAQMPGSWWAGGLINESLMHDRGNKLTPGPKYANNNISDKNQVVVLDGVWMCIRRSLFDRVKFDESTFKGFHFYDIDTCLQIHFLGHKLYCVFDILFQHFGKGKTNLTWVNNALLLQKKWKSNLPTSIVKLGYNEKCNVEYRTLNEFTRIMLANNIPKKTIYLRAITRLLTFYKSYLFYKTPVYLYRYLRSLVSR